MKKERTFSVNSGDDLEIMSEIIKNDPWLLEQVFSKIRAIRAAPRSGDKVRAGNSGQKFNKDDN